MRHSGNCRPLDLECISPEIYRALLGEDVFRRHEFMDFDRLPRLTPLAQEDSSDARASVDVETLGGAHDPLRMSDERLRSAVEAAEVGTWHVDIATGLDARDASLNRILGLEPVESTQPVADFFDHVHEEDRERAREAFRAATAGAGRYEVEVRICRPSGEVRWVRDIGRVRRGPDGQPLYATGAMTDITELKEAQRAIAESASFYEQTLESIPGMTFTNKPDGACDYVSRQWVEFTGVQAPEHYGSGWLSMLHPDDRERAFAAWQSAVTATGAYDLEYRVRRRDGEYEWFKVRGRAIRDGSGKIVRWLGTAVNVNDLKHTEAALRESEEQLRSADRRKDEFLATLAHELRNPLAPIRSGVDVLKRARDEETRRRAEHTIERQLGHMVRLVDDLLDVSRISRGQVELQRRKLSLATVIESALETSRPLIVQAGHELTVDMPEDPPWVDGDLTRLAQVVANLLNNAAKYTPDGGRIDLAVRAEARQAVIRVTDTGMGIDAASLPRVFELFTRGALHKGRAQGGLGIGLSLVRDLVEMHAGTVTAQSAGVGRGSTFEVRLPLTDPASVVETSARAWSADRVGDEDRPHRILVVDDNVDAAEMLGAMLELNGHETHVAHDGPAALVAARELAPDVIFLDIGLPGMDGYAVARQLRADPAFGRTVLVALTGWGSNDDKRRATEAGFDAHLTKPVDVAAVEAIIRGQRDAHEEAEGIHAEALRATSPSSSLATGR